MRLMTSRVNRVSVLAVEGELTTVTAAWFLRQARGAMTSSVPLLVALDLSRLCRIDSSGCAALLWLRREVMRRRGQLYLFGLGPEVRWLIEVMQAHVILDIAPDLAGALEAMGIRGNAAADASGPPGRSRSEGRSNVAPQQIAS